MRGKADFVQHRVEKVGGAVASKHTARAIGAVRARSEAENENLSVDVAETWDGLGPVFPIEVGATLDGANLAAMFDEPRTLRASGDVAIEFGELLNGKLGGSLHDLFVAAHAKVSLA